MKKNCTKCHRWIWFHARRGYYVLASEYFCDVFSKQFIQNEKHLRELVESDELEMVETRYDDSETGWKRSRVKVFNADNEPVEIDTRRWRFVNDDDYFEGDTPVSLRN